MPPKVAVALPPHQLPGCTSSPYSPRCGHLFLVGCKLINQRPSKATMYFILYVFLSFNSLPQMIGQCPPTRSPPVHLCYIIPPTASTDYQLIVEYLD